MIIVIVCTINKQSLNAIVTKHWTELGKEALIRSSRANRIIFLGVIPSFRPATVGRTDFN